jgi:hypothetical protein
MAHGISVFKQKRPTLKEISSSSRYVQYGLLFIVSIWTLLLSGLIYCLSLWGNAVVAFHRYLAVKATFFIPG